MNQKEYLTQLSDRLSRQETTCKHLQKPNIPLLTALKIARITIDTMLQSENKLSDISRNHRAASIRDYAEKTKDSLEKSTLFEAAAAISGRHMVDHQIHFLGRALSMNPTLPKDQIAIALDLNASDIQPIQNSFLNKLLYKSCCGPSRTI